jgi:hypothetical protein
MNRTNPNRMNQKTMNPMNPMNLRSRKPCSILPLYRMARLRAYSRHGSFRIRSAPRNMPWFPRRSANNNTNRPPMNWKTN